MRRDYFYIFAVLFLTSPAAAQENCGAAPNPQARANCYQQMEQIYHQQQQLYENQARQQYQLHQDVGRWLRVAPGGRYWAPAWNAPRYYYDQRYGRP